MSTIHLSKHSLLTALLLAILALGLPGKCLAAAETEDQLIKDLDSPRAGTVTDALQRLEKEYPTSTNAFPKMKQLLSDPRLAVKRKAARVLGVVHAPVDEADISHIIELLKSSENATVTDGLKALRGLDAPQAVPDIVPLLNHSNSHIVRDACRTLAVLGNQDLIPKIEPLVNNPDPAIQKDAMDAIAALKSKP